MLEVDLVVVGSLNVDLLMQCERLPAPGETLLGHGFSQMNGGKGANQAVAAARAGARVAMVGAVGQDAYGKNLLTALQADGVDTRHVQIAEHQGTGLASIWVAASGENSIVLLGGANQTLSSDHVRKALAQINARALVVQGEVPEAATTEALQIARARAWRTCVNPAPFVENASMHLGLADLIVLNETEAAFALQCESGAVNARPAQALQGLRALFPKASIVLTLGANGAWLGTESGAQHYPARAVTVVDTTAAGDTLTGALLAGELRGESLEQALREAIDAAGICVSRLGAQSSIPRRQPTIEPIR